MNARPTNGLHPISRRSLMLASGSAAACAPFSQANAAAGERILYRNPLAAAADVADFILEGDANISFPEARMVLENRRPPEEGQAANFVYWCPATFPGDVEISWQFRPLREPGLCILFFGARGLVEGRRVSPLDPRLAPRQGLYDQYNNSDLEYLSISYFRRRLESERRLNVVNLRFAPGFELLAQAADPIPSVYDGHPLHRLSLRKQGRRLTFTVDDLPVLDYTAPRHRRWPGGGNIGFRQMAPLRAEYANLVVRAT